MIARISASIALGAVVTFGLLFTMQRMIANGKEVLSAPDSAHFVEFVRIERAQVVETRAEKPERIPEPERRPDRTQPDLSNTNANSLAVSITTPQIGVGAEVTAGIAGISDGEFLPVVKVAPVYPMRALTRRMEGFVIVEFTVTSAGTVTNVAALESSAPIFEDAAIEAALKFKYKPRVINGTAVDVAGVTNRITFTLDQSQRMAMQ